MEAVAFDFIFKAMTLQADSWNRGVHCTLSTLSAIESERPPHTAALGAPQPLPRPVRDRTVSTVHSGPIFVRA
jgi:hypothetical protein